MALPFAGADTVRARSEKSAPSDAFSVFPQATRPSVPPAACGGSRGSPGAQERIGWLSNGSKTYQAGWSSWTNGTRAVPRTGHGRTASSVSSSGRPDNPVCSAGRGGPPAPRSGPAVAGQSSAKATSRRSPGFLEKCSRIGGRRLKSKGPPSGLESTDEVIAFADVHDCRSSLLLLLRCLHLLPRQQPPRGIAPARLFLLNIVAFLKEAQKERRGGFRLPFQLGRVSLFIGSRQAPD